MLLKVPQKVPRETHSGLLSSKDALELLFHAEELLPVILHRHFQTPCSLRFCAAAEGRRTNLQPGLAVMHCLSSHQLLTSICWASCACSIHFSQHFQKYDKAGALERGHASLGNVRGELS